MGIAYGSSANGDFNAKPAEKRNSCSLSSLPAWVHCSLKYSGLYLDLSDIYLTYAYIIYILIIYESNLWETHKHKQSLVISTQIIILEHGSHGQAWSSYLGDEGLSFIQWESLQCYNIIGVYYIYIVTILDIILIIIHNILYNIMDIQYYRCIL